MRRILVLLLCTVLVAAWLIPSYLFVGTVAGMLAHESIWQSGLFYLIWFFASVSYLMVVRRFARKHFLAGSTLVSKR